MNAYRITGMVMVIAAAIASMKLVETSTQPVKIKKFDIAVIVDSRPLTGETGWTMSTKYRMASLKEITVNTIIGATQKLEKLYDLKIGVFTYNGKEPPRDQFFGDSSEANSTVVRVLNRSSADPADHLIGDDISRDVLKVKESLRSDGRKNRWEAKDIVLWVTAYKVTTTQQELQRMHDEKDRLVEKIFKSAKGDVDGIFTVEWARYKDLNFTDDYFLCYLSQTPSGSPEWYRLPGPKYNPGLSVHTVKEAMSNYLNSLEGEVTSEAPVQSTQTAHAVPGAKEPTDRPKVQLETWHIVLISLGATALLSLLILSIFLCVVIRKRNSKTPHRRRSPDRRDASNRSIAAQGTYDSRLSQTTDRSMDDSRFSRSTDRTRGYRPKTLSRPSVKNRRR